MSASLRPLSLPLPPTREQLLMWLQAEETDAPRVFRLSATDTEGEKADTPTCPILLWLKKRYGFNRVRADGWRLWKGDGHGIMVAFDADDVPTALALSRTFEIVHDELWKEFERENRDVPYDHLTREEIIDILKNVENPHDAAYRIINARRLASAGTESRSVGSG